MVTKVSFHGKFVIPGDSGDVPASGTITITPSNEVRDPTGNVILTMVPRVYELSATGEISGALYATDDATVPTGWSYQIVERFHTDANGIKPEYKRTWTLTVPMATVGTLELSDVTDATVPDPFVNYVTQAALPTPVIDVLKYGAKGDATFALDAAVASGSKTVTSVELQPFLGQRNCWIPGAGPAGGLLTTTITCTVAGTGTLGVAASTTVNVNPIYWGTDDTAAFQAAIVDAMPTAATIRIPEGRKYFLSAPLVLTTTLSVQPMAMPSFVSNGNGGAIGDELNHIIRQTSTALIALPTFPLGSYMIDYQQSAAPYASTGVRVMGFTMFCSNRAAGFRMQGPREARIADLTIVQAAAPSAAMNAHDVSTGAFSIAAFTGADNSSAYNIIEHITIWKPALDAYFDDTNGENTYIGCRAYGPGNASYRCIRYNNATYIDCHYGYGNYGVSLSYIAGPQFIGLSVFNGFGYPKKNAVYLEGGWQYDNPGYYPPSFTNCRLISEPETAPANEADGSTIRFAKLSVYFIGAVFTGCYIGAHGNLVTDWVYSDAAISGGYAIFRDCIFNGTVTTRPYNDQSNIMQFKNCLGVGGAVAIPDSGVISTRREVAVTTTRVLTSASFSQMHSCAVTSGSPYTVTLPTPVGSAGQQIGIRVTPSSADLLTLATAAGNIDGSATRIMWAGESAILESDGTNWVKIAGKTIPMQCQLYLGASGQQLPSAAITAVPVDTTRIDNTGKMATLGTNAVTIRRPGIYLVQTRLALLKIDGTAIPFQLTRFLAMAQKNGTTMVLQHETSGQPAGSQPTFAAQDDVVLAAGDTVKALAFQAMTSVAPLLFQNGPTPDKCQLSVREVPSW